MISTSATNPVSTSDVRPCLHQGTNATGHRAMVVRGLERHPPLQEDMGDHRVTNSQGAGWQRAWGGRETSFANFPFQIRCGKELSCARCVARHQSTRMNEGFPPLPTLLSFLGLALVGHTHHLPILTVPEFVIQNSDLKC